MVYPTQTAIDISGKSPYRVTVGRDLDEVLLDSLAGVDRVAVLYADPVRAHCNRLTSLLASHGHQPLLIEVPDGEAGKRLEVVERCWATLEAAGHGPNDVVLGLGGGAVTDLAGFVAARWLCGVPVVQVPTSLLGMVDAAVGGKTGINTAAGKNLVGAFHPPVAVVCDLNMLNTLPAGELCAGLAEVVKCGFIADPVILELIELSTEDVMNPGRPVLRELIERAVRVKASIVSADPQETGPREHLNYGHTLAHAIEKVEQYRWKHGHAVSVGLAYAAALAYETGRLDRMLLERHRTVLSSLNLPVWYHGRPWHELLASMRIDKKARGSQLKFVLLRGLADPVTVDAPSEDLMRAAFQSLAR